MHAKDERGMHAEREAERAEWEERNWLVVRSNDECVCFCVQIGQGLRILTEAYQ